MVYRPILKMRRYMSLLLNNRRIVLLCIFIMYSCIPTEIDDELVGVEDLTPIKGKQLILDKKSEIIIIQYVDFDSSSCVQQIMNWQNFFDQNNLPLENSLYLIGYGDYHRTLLVAKQIDFDGHILYDKNEEFNSRNSVFDLKDQNCIILKNNQKYQLKLNFYNEKTVKELERILII